MEQPENYISINSFKGGLNTRDFPDSIADNEATELKNFLMNRDGSLEKRAGSLKYNSAEISANQPVHSIFRYYKAGYKKMLCVCNSNLYLGDDGAGTWSSIAVLSNNNVCSFVVYNDILYFTNGTDFKQYDGTTVSNIAGTPKVGKYLAVRKERIYVAGATKPNRIYFCDSGDPTDWDAVAGDPDSGVNYVDMGAGDNDVIMGILNLRDVLVVYKRNSIWILAGTTQSNFFTSKVIDNLGCVSPKTIIGHKNVHYFLYRDGLHVFDGSVTAKVSDKVSPLIEDAVTLESAAGTIYKERYWLSFRKSGDSANKSVLVLDTRSGFGGWSEFTGLNISSFVAWNGGDDNGELHSGDSVLGFVRKLDTGLDDDGTDITVSFKSKHFVPGHDVIMKRLSRLYIKATVTSSFVTVIANSDFNRILATKTISLSKDYAQWNVAQWNVGLWGGSTELLTIVKSTKPINFRGLMLYVQESSSAALVLAAVGGGYVYKGKNVEELG